MSYFIDGMIGVDLNLIGQDNSTAGKLLPAYTVGTKRIANDGVYQYLKAAGTIAVGDFVKITSAAGAFTCVQGTTTLFPSTEPARGAVSILALTTGQYAWFFIGPGLISVNVLVSCVQDVKLYTTATAGAVDDSATTLIPGLKLITTLVGGAVAPCVADMELQTVIA